MAENKYGVGPALESFPVVAKEQFNVPSAPQKPVASNFNSSCINIKWEKPVSDGGSPIIGYVVQYKENNSTHWRTEKKYILLFYICDVYY